jgi:hypothetical protein
VLSSSHDENVVSKTSEARKRRLFKTPKPLQFFKRRIASAFADESNVLGSSTISFVTLSAPDEGGVFDDPNPDAYYLTISLCNSNFWARRKHVVQMSCS